MDESLRMDATELLVQVRRLRVGYTRFLVKSLAPLNLNIPQYTALAVLGEKGQVTMGTLAEGLGITMGAVTNMVDRLIAAGLADRARGEDDRRVVRVQLTDRGREALGKAIDIGVEYFSRYLVDMSHDERQAFIAAYRSMADRSMKDFSEARERG